MGHPTDALSLRTNLHEQLRGQGFRSQIDQYLGDGKNLGLIGERSINGHMVGLNSTSEEYNASAMERALSVAENFWVSTEMCELALMAGRDFPRTEPIHRHDPPSEAGLLMFETPYRALDIRGGTVAVHAVLWLSNRQWLLVDRRDLQDMYNFQHAQDGINDRLIREIGRWDIANVGKWKWEAPMPLQMSLVGAALPMGSSLRVTRNENGQIAAYTDYALPEGVRIEEATDQYFAFQLAIWRLMQQSLADVSEETKHNKSAMRYALRAKVPLTGVTVIRLRRIEHHYEPTGVGINYRTVVRGHWRKVWCGPRNKPEEQYQRAVYIHPFIRGPEGAPLIIRRRVNALVR